MGAERGHSCYPLELQPGRTPVQVLILDQLTTQSPLTYCAEGRYVKLVLSLYSFSTFSVSFKFGLCWLWWKYILKSITFNIPIGGYGYLGVYFVYNLSFYPLWTATLRNCPRWEPSDCITPPPQLFPNSSFACLCSVKWHKWEYQCTFWIASPQMHPWCCTHFLWKNKAAEKFCLTWPFTA